VDAAKEGAKRREDVTSRQVNARDATIEVVRKASEKQQQAALAASKARQQAE
jgi:hypothetical protein